MKEANLAVINCALESICKGMFENDGYGDACCNDAHVSIDEVAALMVKSPEISFTKTMTDLIKSGLIPTDEYDDSFLIFQLIRVVIVWKSIVAI